MNPTTTHPTAPYAPITQTISKHGIIYALLVTSFLFLILGAPTQVFPEKPPIAPKPVNPVIFTTKPPLIPPEPPKAVEPTPQKISPPILVIPLDKFEPTQIPNTDIIFKHSTLTGIGTFNPENFMTDIIDQAHLDIQPTPLITAKPIHPYEKKKAGISGTVLVEFLIDPTGHVVDPVIIHSSDSDFENPTLKAIRKWTFSPGLKNGEAVWTRAQIPFEFSVNN